MKSCRVRHAVVVTIEFERNENSCYRQLNLIASHSLLARIVDSTEQWLSTLVHARRVYWKLSKFSRALLLLLLCVCGACTTFNVGVPVTCNELTFSLRSGRVGESRASARRRESSCGKSGGKLRL